MCAGRRVATHASRDIQYDGRFKKRSCRQPARRFHTTKIQSIHKAAVGLSVARSALF